MAISVGVGQQLREMRVKIPNHANCMMLRWLVLAWEKGASGMARSEVHTPVIDILQPVVGLASCHNSASSFTGS